MVGEPGGETILRGIGGMDSSESCLGGGGSNSCKRS